MNKIIILNGPNLNLLGEREKKQYGNFTLKDIEKSCKEYSSKNNIKLTFFQSNIEGELVDQIQASRNHQDGLIINAGGYTHTSVAIHDALKILKIPIIGDLILIPSLSSEDLSTALFCDTTALVLTCSTPLEAFETLILV